MPESWGHEVERYARNLAGGLGVPDFVYEPLVEQKGGGSREISDGLLICGDDGLIMQVKSRGPVEAALDTAVKARAWLKKSAAAGASQAVGTRRRLSLSRSATFKSLRGYERTLRAVPPWPAVVLLDHPATPRDVHPDPVPDTLFMTLGDWHALHERLRSTAAVIQYVQRALDTELDPPLGSERLRYDTLARADASALGGVFPLLPAHSLQGEDRIHAAFVEDLIEKVWPQDGPWPWQDPDDYRRIVEVLDRIPPAVRATVGRKMWQTFLQVRRTKERRSFLMVDSSQEARLAFVYDTLERVSSESQMARLSAIASVRQNEALESGAADSSVTLGVGILHDEDRGRQFTFAYVEGRPPLSGAVRWHIDNEFGAFDGATVRSLPKPGRNDRCPCGSGKKYKNCCRR